MNEFDPKFLAEDAKRLGHTIFLAGFGKHPGWDDHIQDIGTDTETLVQAKQLLYVQGIGGQIDAGAWDKLDPDAQLPGFNHLFVWQRNAQILIGRMWSSVDGKGRTRYPMIACAHCLGLPLATAIHRVLPALQEIQQACGGTKSASDVVAIFRQKLIDLRSASDTANGLSEEQRRAFLAQTDFAPQHERLFRILYQLQSQTATNRSAIQMRVPSGASRPELALLLWGEFFRGWLAPGTVLLLTLPLDQLWVDATVGAPSTREFFCLRAGLRAVALASEVPYNLSADFRVKATQFLADFQQDRAKIKRRCAGRWLAMLVFVVLLAAGAALLVSYPPGREVTREKFVQWVWHGRLEITSEPVGAAVWLNGREIGVTPLILATVAPGPVSCELRLKNHEPVQLSGSVRLWDTLALSAKLRPSRMTEEEEPSR